MNIIKVDRVTTAQEALALEAAGATVIGINLGLDPRCPARSFVSNAVGQEIRRALTRAKLCVMLDPDVEDPDTAIAQASSINPSLLTGIVL